MKSYWICTAVIVIPLACSAVELPRGETTKVLPWSSGATLQRLFRSPGGSLTVSTGGIDFVPKHGSPEHWRFDDIRTVEIHSPRRLSLITYQNRRWHIPGDRPFEFRLKSTIPPEVAAELVQKIGKPAINAAPRADGDCFAALGARHITRFGGSQGVLRLCHPGIKYITNTEGDSRSWRWADIQTVAHPEPYRFRIGGYLETFDFELKQSLTDDLFDRLWDYVYAKGLNVGRR